MTNAVIFQVNPEAEYRLSDALEAMAQMREQALWLSPKPETNMGLKAKDVVYLWVSASKRPTLPAHLVARGEVTQAPTTPMDMPVWQRMFCVDEATGQSGPQFHSKMPRAEIQIEKWLAAGKNVDRDRTGANPVLRTNRFLKKRGFYSGTIFRLKWPEALELDKLAGW